MVHSLDLRLCYKFHAIISSFITLPKSVLHVSFAWIACKWRSSWFVWFITMFNETRERYDNRRYWLENPSGKKNNTRNNRIRKKHAITISWLYFMLHFHDLHAFRVIYTWWIRTFLNDLLPSRIKHQPHVYSITKFSCSFSVIVIIIII